MTRSGSQRRVLEKAAKILGDREKALRWFDTANRALGGKAPRAFLETEQGLRQIEEVLGRIEHGVYS